MITESEIISRHMQSLSEAHSACQKLGKNADPTYLAPRGHQYGNLKRALNALEGSCRQMAHFRADARWLRLGIVYAKAMRAAQAKFVGQRWNYFNAMMELFIVGQRRMAELRDAKTGARGPVLPTRPASDWLILPDHRPAIRPPGILH